MKFQIKLNTIKEYLRRLSVSVQSVSSRVEFTGVLINVWDNSITFEGRNDWMDTKIEETSLTDVKIIETGRALIKAQMLNDIVQKMEGQYVTFTKVDANVLTIEDADSNYQINLLSDENFEVAKYASEFNEEISIPSKIFSKAMTKTVFAGNENHTKFIYQGVNININNNKINVTACDGIKIASWSGNIENNVNINKIVPLKVVKELLKILPDSGEYKFMFSNSHCVIKSDNMINQFSLIEGTFPVFDKYFNNEIYNKRLTIDKDVLSSSIDKAVILINHFDSARIGLTVDNEIFVVDTKDEVGSAKIEVKGFDYSGEKIAISLSPKVLIEGIKHSTSDKIEILFTNETSSVLLTTEKGDFKYLMSPMV